MSLLKAPDTAQDTDLSLDRLDQAELAFWCAIFKNSALQALADLTPEKHSDVKERWTALLRENGPSEGPIADLVKQMELISAERGVVIVGSEHAPGARPEGPIVEMNRLLNQNQIALKDTSATAFFRQLGFRLNTTNVEAVQRYSFKAAWLLLQKSRGDTRLHFVPVTDQASVQRTRDELRLWRSREQRIPTFLPQQINRIWSLSCEGAETAQVILESCLEQNPGIAPPWGLK